MLLCMSRCCFSLCLSLKLFGQKEQESGTGGVLFWDDNRDRTV